MSKLTIIKIDRGDFDSGFDATVRIEENGGCIYDQTHRLPPASHLPELYQSWKSGYSDRHLRGDNDGENTPLREKSSFRVIKIVEGQTTNLSIGELANDLERGLNEWLNSLERGVQEFREGLLENLSKTEEIRFVIETGDEILERLPWERWDFFDRYDNGDVVLNFPNRVTPRPGIQLKEKVKILVILGESSDIDVQADLHLLQDRLPSDAEILEPLIATSREKVDRALWDKKFDILFFAGHSSTDFGNGRGKFYINDTESLTVADLKEGLKRAIANGLKLAIFNSCDGIGLGRDLTDLQMPAIVVMREKIPDEAAQRFLEFFLKAFALEGKTLSAAVTEAKKRLIGIEGRYPCASWLPVLCQHPEAEMLTWQSLREVKQKRQLKLPELQSLPKVVGGSLLIAAAVMGLRWTKVLQPVELVAWDVLMAQRPEEAIDERITVVEITSEEVGKYDDILPDDIIAEAIAKLQAAKPRAIGLALHRYKERGQGYKELHEQLKLNNVYLICALGSRDKIGYPPPPQLTKTQVRNQVGLSDLFIDKGFSGSVRRQLLSYHLDKIDFPSQCPNSPFSLNFLLAYNFLSKEDKYLELTENEEDWRQGELVFKGLSGRFGGYQDLGQKKNEILLNYRARRKPARKITLTQLLEEPLKRDWIEDKIIIIGKTDRQEQNVNTPYGLMPRVWVHVHQVSQLISAVMDGRPLIWVLPQWGNFQWGDALFVWVWALTGGLIAWGLRSPWKLGLASGVAIIVLYQTSLIILTKGGWMPLIPSAMALLLAEGWVVADCRTEEQDNKLDAAK